jgi:hypothetical protein
LLPDWRTSPLTLYALARSGVAPEREPCPKRQPFGAAWTGVHVFAATPVLDRRRDA